MKIPPMVAMMPGFAEMLANVKEVKRTAEELCAAIDAQQITYSTDNHANETLSRLHVYEVKNAFVAALARLPEMPEI